MFRYFVFITVLLALFISSNGQSVIVDVCNSDTVNGFRYINNGFEVCQSTPGNPSNFEFVPVCDSTIYSCDGCSLTCQNGGTCVTASVSGCLCTQNWGGQACETRVNDCVLGTVCLTDGIPFRQCFPSIPFNETYLRDTCLLPGVDCNPSSCSLTCQNNGRCVTVIALGNTAQICACANGYTGTLCDTMRTPLVESTLCNAGYGVSALWTLIALAVFALCIISVI